MKPSAASAPHADAAAGSGGGVWDRVAWTVGDQALSSATNIATAVVAARSLDRDGFGAFGLAFAVYLLAVGGCRSLVTEPLVGLYSGAPAAERQRAGPSAAGAAVGLGLAAAAVLGAAAALAGGDAGRALGALAAVLPGLVLQDAWRYWFVAAGRPRSALANDAVWCATQAASLAVLALAFGGRPGLVAIVAWWGGSGTVAALVGCRQAGAVPALGATASWVAGHRRLGGRYALEFATATGAAQLTLLGLGTVAGLAALGAVRGAQVFFGPVNVAFGGIYLALAAEGSRLGGDPRRLRRVMVLASAALIVAVVAWLAVGLALPRAAGRALFGASWEPSRRVLVPVGVAMVGGAAAAGAIAGLRALAAARASLRARLVGLPAMLGLPLAGAAAGAPGFATGLAAATLIGAGLWWWQLDRALAGVPPKGPAPVGPAPGREPPPPPGSDGGGHGR